MRDNVSTPNQQQPLGGEPNFDWHNPIDYQHQYQSPFAGVTDDTAPPNLSPDSFAGGGANIAVGAKIVGGGDQQMPDSTVSQDSDGISAVTGQPLMNTPVTTGQADSGGFGVDVTSQTGVPGGGYGDGGMDGGSSAASQYSGFSNYSPTGASDMSSASSSYNNAMNSMGQSLSGVCQQCYSQTVAAVSPVINQIVKYIKDADKCTCDCKQSLAVQLGNLSASASENANNASQTVSPPPSPSQLMSGGSGSMQVTPPPPTSMQQQPHSYPGVAAPPVSTQPQVVYVPGVSRPTITLPGHGQKYKSYCNRDFNDVLIQFDEESPPIGNWDYIATGTDPAALEQQARQQCSSRPKPKPPASPFPQVGQYSWDCDLRQYITLDHLESFVTFATKLREDNATGIAIHEAATHVFDGVDKLPLTSVIAELGKRTLWGPKWVADAVVPVATQMLGCQSEVFAAAMSTLNILGYVEQHLGFQLTEHKLPFQYMLNSQCRTKHLSPDSAMAAYLSNSIDAYALDTIWAINGYCPQDVKWAVDSSQAKLVPEQLVDAAYRGIIDVDAYAKGMRRLGYTDDKAIQTVYSLWGELPPVSDLVRFMVRDADDDNIVKSLGLDDLFHDKFGPSIADWCKQQGVPEKMMQYVWRSHWTIPGPSQLFEFFQRLRRNAKFGTEDEQRSKIEKALIHNDILPTWFDSFFAVQFSPLSQRQLRMAFNAGTIDEQELDDGYAAIGYSDDDAKTLTEYTKRQKILSAQSLPAVRLWLRFGIDHQGLRDRLHDYKFDDSDIDKVIEDAQYGFEQSTPVREFTSGRLPIGQLEGILSQQGCSPALFGYIREVVARNVRNVPAIDEYKSGTISRDTALGHLANYGVPADVANDTVNAIDDSYTRSRLNLCIQHTRRRFLAGAINSDQSTMAIVNAGAVQEYADKIVTGWQCLLEQIDKAIPVGKLCSWLTEGAITSGQFYQRAKNLGYNDTDAQLLLAECLYKIDKAMTKQQAKDQAAEEKRQQNEAKQLAKLQSTLAKQQQQGERLQGQKARAKINRMKQLAASITYVSKNGKLTPDVATQIVANAKTALEKQYGLGEDEVLQLILTTASKWRGGTAQDYISLLSDAAELYIAEQLPDSIQDLVSGETVNGVTQPS
jgi:hypothetical protein